MRDSAAMRRARDAVGGISRQRLVLAAVLTATVAGAAIVAVLILTSHTNSATPPPSTPALVIHARVHGTAARSGSTIIIENLRVTHVPRGSKASFLCLSGCSRSSATGRGSGTITFNGLRGTTVQNGAAATIRVKKHGYVPFYDPVVFHSQGAGFLRVTYESYTNKRYGYRTLRPASFSPLAPPEDGSGQTWKSPDGKVSFAVSGYANYLGSPQKVEVAESQNAQSSGVHITHSSIHGDRITFSGSKDGGRTSVYRMEVVGSGHIDVLYWQYPTAERSRWRSAVAWTVQTFHAGNLGALD